MRIVESLRCFLVAPDLPFQTTGTVRPSKKSGGVAKKSLHMKGQAIDIRLRGHDLRDVRAAALALRGGGVGYYAKSDFIHVDTGRVRRW